MPYFLMVFSLLLPLSAAFFLPAAFMLSGNKLRKYYASSAMLCSALCLVALAAYACRAARPYELSVLFAKIRKFNEIYNE